MVFDSGAKLTADLIEQIANGLIATLEGYWSDADASWTTVTRSGNEARRALKFDNGVEPVIYLALEVINTHTDYYYGNQGWWRKGRGIRVVFSSEWDATTKIYIGSIQSTFVAFEGCANCPTSDLATTQITYFQWIETNGFVIMGKPEPTGSNEQQSFIIVVERVPTASKEYADNLSNFFCYAAGNIWQEMYDGNWPVTLLRNRSILRPFAYQFPDYSGGGSWGQWDANGNGISFPPLPGYVAYKSIGNGKVYYIKPILNNQATQFAPIFQSELFFKWSEGVGLIDGDVIAVQGQPVKFLCKALDSPDNANRLAYAIKYFG